MLPVIIVQMHLKRGAIEYEFVFVETYHLYLTFAKPGFCIQRVIVTCLYRFECGLLCLLLCLCGIFFVLCCALRLQLAVVALL